MTNGINIITIENVMKKILLAALATMFCAAVSAQTKSAPLAQNIMVVNSERIFTSLPDYNQAITDLDTLAAQKQRAIDDAFAAVGRSYDDYMARRASMTDAQRQQQENTITSQEQQITQFQQDTFGPDGTMMKKRVETIKPIQERVFKVISDYATAGNFAAVIDQSSNASLLYFAPANDRTDAIIQLLKK